MVFIFLKIFAPFWLLIDIYSLTFLIVSQFLFIPMKNFFIIFSSFFSKNYFFYENSESAPHYLFSTTEGVCLCLSVRVASEVLPLGVNLFRSEHAAFPAVCLICLFIYMFI